MLFFRDYWMVPGLLGGPWYNTRALLCLSWNVSIFARVNTVIEQFCNHPLYLSSNRPTLCCPMAITESSLIQFYAKLRNIFFISNLLGKYILTFPLSHLSPWSMAWNKTGTWEEPLQASFSRSVTLDRGVAEGVRRVSLDLQRIQILWRQETGKHPWMKGDFSQAQNVPLKKQ